MIKIISVVDNEIISGGGFNQALNAIIQINELKKNNFNFEVFTTKKKNIFFLNQLNIKAFYIKVSFFDKLYVWFSGGTFWYLIQRHLKICSPLEKKLIRNGCDLVYFVTPSALALSLQKLNYIFTLWDLCHIESPEFPEVRDFNTSSIREKHYRKTLNSAFLVLTESKRLIEIASQHFGLNKNRFLARPLSPSPFLDKSHSQEKYTILKKYKLTEGYFFYPAQFWAHKNHVRILQALIRLRDLNNWSPNVVFCGQDYGNLNYIKKFIEDNNLGSQVKLLGFVPVQDMRGLYENSSALIMPTYFGPTNIPPLEAWALGIPLIYSSHLFESVGKAALLVNPDNSEELANAMLMSTNLKTRTKLITQGYKMLSQNKKFHEIASKDLSLAIKKFSKLRECWL